MGGLFSSPPPPQLPAPAPLPSYEDPGVVAEGEAVRLANLRRRGRAASVMTGGSGLLDNPETNAPEAGAEQLG